MSRSLRRGAVAALILATAPILAACSAGSGAATLQVKPNVAATSIGKTLKLNGISLIAATDGTSAANITTNIANGNTAPETLESVSVDGTPAVLSGPAVIPAGGSLLLSGPGEVTARAASISERPGQNATVTFTFANAGSVTVQALVNAGTGQYAPYAPSTAPTVPATPAAPSPSGSTKATDKATDKATAKSTAKPTDKASDKAGPTPSTSTTA